ncbi:helix-turn-helix domain-containing protein [Tenacibaculum tangerinum]|uniref:Helix-turn-helix domain-containing protein n=1 Tax=Tenacibaculum tangerinum TaxID=3038772 RepID=A0ABY8L3I6_9FLAO|nr:helix-turn-helix domain-containing protein [Tenacibaculum tangerinum]WGH75831.1 helix-turn-helix domain-containing protein [Tenacibaculum tangerinum]
MTVADLFNLFLLISAIHGFAFSIILFCSKNGREKSMVYLNLLILVISLNNIQSWALERGLLQNKFELVYMQFSWHFLAMPFLYMFLIHYLNLAKKSFNILKIVIPVFLLLVIAQISFVVYYSDSASEERLEYIYKRYSSLEELFSMLTSVGIFIYSMYILYKKEKLFPKILSYDNLKWLYTFFILSTIGYLLWIIALTVTIRSNFDNFLVSYYPLRIFTTVLIYWLGYQGLRQIRLLKEREKIRASLLIDLNGNFNIDTINLSSEKNCSDHHLEKQKEQFIQIDTFIKSQKKFLLNKYTLQDLSKDIELSSSTLSSIINNIAKKSFTDYLNEMRVNLAKKLLLDPDYGEYTITSIGLESGFNSKSTFYTVFKKYTGHTPVEFKNSTKT